MHTLTKTARMQYATCCVAMSFYITLGTVCLVVAEPFRAGNVRHQSHGIRSAVHDPGMALSEDDQVNLCRRSKYN